MEKQIANRIGGWDTKEGVYSLSIETDGEWSPLRMSLERLFSEASMLRSSMIPYFDGRDLRGFDIEQEHVFIDSEGRIRESSYEVLKIPMRRFLMSRYLEEMRESRYRLRPGRVREVLFPEYGKSHAITGISSIALTGIREYIPVKGLEQFSQNEDLKVKEFRLIRNEDESFTVKVRVAFKIGLQARPDVKKVNKVIGLYLDPKQGIFTSGGEILRASLPIELEDEEGYVDPKAHQRELAQLEAAYAYIMNKLEPYEKILLIDNDIYLPEVYPVHGKEFRSILNRVRGELLKDKRLVRMSPHLKAGTFCPRCGTYEKYTEGKYWHCPECKGPAKSKPETAAENLVWFYEHGIGIGESRNFEIEERIRKEFEGRKKAEIV